MTEKTLNNCSSCDHLDKMFWSSGGIAGAPLYHMYCDHPDIVAAVAFSDIIPTRLLTKNPDGETLEEQRTPEWCPFIQGIK